MVHARSRSRAVTAFVMIVMCIGASFAACADLKRSNGEECTKNEECGSLVCASMKCVAQPPLLDGVPDAGEQPDTSSSGVDAGKDSAGGKDSAPAADTGEDGPGQDALNDVGLDSSDSADDAVAIADSASDDANDANDDASSDAEALSDASDAARDADVFDATLDVGLDANVPDVLGG